MHARTQTRAARSRVAMLICAALLAACDPNTLPAPQATLLATLTAAQASTPIAVTLAPGSTSEPVSNVTLTVPTAAPTETPAPTDTPAPVLAARVNDAEITIDMFNAETARLLGNVDPASDEGQKRAAEMKDAVLDSLIQKALIAQEAARQGVAISEQQIDDELAFAQEKSGGADKYAAWLAANRLTDEDAREMVRSELLGAALRDRVLAAMPREAEHVRAFHILLATEAEAQQVMTRLDAGAKLGPLAQANSIDDSTRADDGDLCWFARGTGAILWPEVEAAAFALQPGETSGIVRSPIGFHIIRVTERQLRPLSDADLAAVQQAALEKWLAQLQSQAKIEKFV